MGTDIVAPAKKPARRRKPNGTYEVQKFTPENRASIVDACRIGMPFKGACALADVHYRTGADWLAKGDEDPASEHGQFATDVRRAQAAFQMELLEKIHEAGKAGPQYWAALMTILERVYPEDYKRPSEKGTTVNIGILEKRIHELTVNEESVYTGS